MTWNAVLFTSQLANRTGYGQTGRTPLARKFSWLESW